MFLWRKVGDTPQRRQESIRIANMICRALDGMLLMAFDFDDSPAARDLAVGRFASDGPRDLASNRNAPAGK